MCPNESNRPVDTVIVPENDYDLQVNCAVYIKDLCKRYTKNGPAVLENFGMAVRKGTIYGLLGSSGCGKTTILSCIVGLQTWDSGEVLVFGKKPGSRYSGTPGRKLGYMPQDLALYDQLTIQEVFQFYGRIYDMDAKNVKESWAFVSQLLDLPTGFKQMKNLSGGQKRRASMALAFIHSPELLVIDEPTVGLDPLLRERIWEHLRALVQSRGTTIIITTHYIEEARHSDTIGVIREGRMLVQDAPERLLEMYNCDLLEQVVLNLCRKDKTHASTLAVSHKNKRSESPLPFTWTDDKVISSEVTVTNDEYAKMAGRFTQMLKFDQDFSQRIAVAGAGKHNNFSNEKVANIFAKIQKTELCRALKRTYGFIVVNLLILCRHLWLLFAILLMPSIQGTLTILALGSDPSGMAFGVVNNEVRNWTNECELPSHSSNSCDISSLSCKYLHFLGEEDKLSLKSLDTEQEALAEVQMGRSWGYLLFPDNYSQHGMDRAVAGRYADNETLEGFQIRVRMDHSQSVGAAFLIGHLISSFKNYLDEIVPACELGTSTVETPLHYRPPVYGMKNGSLTAFIMPGIIILCQLGMIMALTSLLVVADLKQGTLLRARAAGLRSIEVIAAYIITQGVVAIVQVVIWQLVLHFYFQFVIVGPIWLWLAFCLVASICGAAMGLAHGIICQDEVAVLIVTVVWTNFCLSYGAAVYPTEVIYPAFLPFAQILPNHLATQGLRSVVIRGLSLTHRLVWPGFLVLVGWIVVAGVFSEYAYRRLCK